MLAYCPDGFNCPWRFLGFLTRWNFNRNSRRGASFAECRGVNPNCSRLSRPRVASLRPLLGRTPRPFCKAPSFWPRPRGAPRSPPPASITCAAISSFCFNPQGTKEGNHHEHKRYLSRRFSRQQDQLAHEAWIALPDADGAPRSKKGIAAGRLGRKAPRGDFAMGGPLGKTKRVTEQWHRGSEQRDGRLHGRPRGIARGGRQAVREASAFHDFPGESMEIMPVLPIPGA